ncbi:MAG: cation diffusion facilitator family transporter [Candidatus Cryptobacteroides sp.]
MRERKIRNITLAGSVVNLMLTAGKLVAGFIGRSSAMVADGIHSLSDLLSDIIVLVFVHISSKGKDKGHDFGHGKFETLATLMVSLILLLVGVKLMATGITSILTVLNGGTIPVPGYIALAAAAISIIAKEVLYHATAKVGKEVDSPVVIANAWHHRSDALSSIGSLIGIGGAIILGQKWTILDPLASCCISIAIIFVAVKMSIPCLGELVDASLPEESENNIINAVRSVEGVRDVHALKTRRSGTSVIVNAHIVVDPQMKVTQAHDIATKVERAISELYGPQTQSSIHIEPDIESE